MHGSKVGFLLLAVCLLPFVADAITIFSYTNLYTYQQEYRFLKKELPQLPKGARVCFLDVNIQHGWPGNHVDFDSAYLFPIGGENYYGYPIVPLRFSGNPEQDATIGQCDYYYESALCNLDIPANPDSHQPVLREDIKRYQSLCRQYLDRMNAVVCASTSATQNLFWLKRKGEPPPIDLRLFKVNSTAK